ncbi:uncharacterized protein LAESUDRAFT_722336, partial [Laetiporus sulphureus 93-53]
MQIYQLSFEVPRRSIHALLGPLWISQLWLTVSSIIRSCRKCMKNSAFPIKRIMWKRESHGFVLKICEHIIGSV